MKIKDFKIQDYKKKDCKTKDFKIKDFKTFCCPMSYVQCTRFENYGKLKTLRALRIDFVCFAVKKDLKTKDYKRKDCKRKDVMTFCCPMSFDGRWFQSSLLLRLMKDG